MLEALTKTFSPGHIKEFASDALSDALPSGTTTLVRQGNNWISEIHKKEVEKAETAGKTLDKSDIKSLKDRVYNICDPGLNLSSIGFFVMDILPGGTNTKEQVEESLKALNSVNSYQDPDSEWFDLLQWETDTILTATLKRLGGRGNKGAQVDKDKFLPILFKSMEHTVDNLSYVAKSMRDPSRRGKYETKKVGNKTIHRRNGVILKPQYQKMKSFSNSLQRQYPYLKDSSVAKSFFQKMDSLVKELDSLYGAKNNILPFNRNAAKTPTGA